MNQLKFLKFFSTLTKFEWGLWLFSLVGVLVCSLLSPDFHLIGTLASLLGVTSLIFIAEGKWQGQILIILFAMLYGLVSFEQRYFGEMITYLCMTSPMAIAAVISWFRHPFRDTGEVAVRPIGWRGILWLAVSSAAVTVLFYFILGALGNAVLLASTLSVTTSFLASALTYLRSPYYALAYAANDVVLIVLWVTAAGQDLSCLPMVLCFAMFLANDLYGFFNWKRMEKRQALALSGENTVLTNRDSCDKI